MVAIPTFQNVTADFVQTIQLDGESYILNIYWNVRAEAWFFSLTSETTQLLSVKIVPNFPLLKQYKYKFPNLAGDLFAFPLTNQNGSRIEYDDWDVKYGLFYTTEAELNSWLLYYGF